jgi:hypothetical protein
MLKCLIFNCLNRPFLNSLQWPRNNGSKSRLEWRFSNIYCILSTPTSTWNHCFVVTEPNSGKVYYNDIYVTSLFRKVFVWVGTDTVLAYAATLTWLPIVFVRVFQSQRASLHTIIVKYSTITDWPIVFHSYENGDCDGVIAKRTVTIYRPKLGQTN